MLVTASSRSPRPGRWAEDCPSVGLASLVAVIRVPESLRDAVEEGLDFRNDAVLLVVGEFGVDGQGQALRRPRLGLGELAPLVAEEGVRRLQVKGDRVVDAGADALGVEVGQQRVAVVAAYDVQVVDA